MKTSTISSLSIQNALRLTVADAQSQLVTARKEVTTGQYADLGVSLGAGVTESLDLTREIARIENLMDTNSIVTQRLSGSQAALSEMATQAQELNKALIALSGNIDATSLNVSKNAVTNALQAFTGAANTSMNGEYLFSGVNTDVRPMTDYTAPGNPAKAAFDSALSTFLAAQAPPAASIGDLSAAQMQDFIENTLEPMFTGAAWKSDWSAATDENMTTRIAKNEVVESSSNVNADGARYFGLASIISIELLPNDMSTDVRKVVATKATAYAGQAIAGIDQQRSKLGLSEARVTAANESFDAQKTIIQTHLADVTGVDAYEASTRLQNLLTLVEASYTLTARIQQLSLVNFL